MKTINTCRTMGLIMGSIIGLTLTFPVATAAQSGMTDATYCTELSHRYQKYISSDLDKRPRPAPANVSEAMSRCRSGDTASAIAVLEKALTDQRIALPPRT